MRSTISANLYKQWREYVDRKGRLLRRHLKSTPADLEALHHASENWSALREYQKMNFLADLSSDFCRIFALGNVRLFSKNSWDIHKISSRYEDTARYERKNHACYVASEGGNFSPIIIYYTDNEHLNEKGFFDAVHTLGHEIGHYCLDVYYRCLDARRTLSDDNLNVAGYFTGESEDIQKLSEYLEIYQFHANDDAHYSRQMALLQEIEEARSKDDQEHWVKTYRKYMRGPDEQGADYVGRTFKKVVESVVGELR